MSQRKFMGLVGGATASGPGIALASQRSANAAAEPGYDDEQEFPLIIANIPATPRQKAWAVGVAVLLIVLAAVIAPFARIQLGQINGFVPVLQARWPWPSSSRQPCYLLNFRSSLNGHFSHWQADTFSADHSHSCKRSPFRTDTLPRVSLGMD